MADPVKYVHSYSFTSWQANNPAAPPPGIQLDVDYNDIETSIDEIVDAIKDIRRSDGELQNEIVTFDSLHPDVAAQLGDGMAAAEAAAEAAAAAAAASEASAAASAVLAADQANRMVGTSVSSVTLGLGNKTFTTQAGKLFSAGTPVTASSDANPTTQLLTGVVSSYVGTTLIVSSSAFVGSGSYSDWTIRVSGLKGETGAAGAPGPGTGDMLASNNLSDLVDDAAARGNLGLGTLAELNAVPDDSITDAKLANMAEGTIKGRVSSGTGSPEDLTIKQLAGFATRSTYGFSARASATTCTTLAYTKIVFSAEDFDLNNNFDSVTNYRYTAPVTGYYQVNAVVLLAALTVDKPVAIAIHKNGTIFKQGVGTAADTGNAGCTVSALMALAAGEYLEIFVFNGDSSNRSIDVSPQNSHFSAHLTLV